ncbi:MAG: lipopolysaccharide transport periplasmic protein LptA [Aquificota bacterium]|nr:MAG: lipopolysaccharide transport periplasmic protein LptA [Aquificota bacterium]
MHGGRDRIYSQTFPGMGEGEKTEKGGAPMRKTAVLAIVIFLSLWGGAMAQKKESKKKTPIVITAKEMEANAKAGWVLFKGTVKAVKENLVLYADRVKIFLSPKDNKIKRILAQGNVKVEQGKRVIMSQEAEYSMKEGVIEFRGHPKAWEGENLVVGEKMLYYPKEDRSVVIGGKGRVNAIIYPKEEKKGEAGSQELGKEFQR